MKGKITGVTNYGNIVELTVKPDDTEFEQTIPMDWRMFMNFLEGACGEDAMMEELLGLHIEYDGETIHVLEEA